FVARLERGEEQEDAKADVTRDRRAFTAMVRNALFRVVRAIALRRFDEAADAVEAPEGEPAWTADRTEAALAPYFERHRTIRTDPGARAPRSTLIEEQDGAWE